jgi:dolichyl-phosphate beta-glucosyltransferase
MSLSLYRFLIGSEKLVNANSKIKLIDNKKNNGKGYVLRQGLLAGEGDYRLFIDADNATTIDHLDLVWSEFFRGVDLVIASRSTKDVIGTKQVVKQAKWKIASGMTGNLIIQFLLVRGIWDTQCGFKVFRKEIIEKTVGNTKTNRWAIDVEMLSLAKKNNFKIGKIAVSWKNSDYSRVGIKGYLVALKEVLIIKKNLFLGKYS